MPATLQGASRSTRSGLAKRSVRIASLGVRCYKGHPAAVIDAVLQLTSTLRSTSTLDPIPLRGVRLGQRQDDG